MLSWFVGRIGRRALSYGWVLRGGLVTVVLAFSACGNDSVVNAGEISQLRNDRVCIASEAPDGAHENCFRIGPRTQVTGDIAEGDFVEVRFKDGEALTIDNLAP